MARSASMLRRVDLFAHARVGRGLRQYKQSMFSRFFTAAPARPVLLAAMLAPSILSAQMIELQLDRFFQSATPELFRAYAPSADSLGTFGTVRASREQIAEEIRLYQEVVESSETMLSPSPLVLALCHNLLIHEPAVGGRFLQLLNRPTADEAVRDYLATAAIASGEPGESLAVAGALHPDATWRIFWADYLKRYAIYESSVPGIVSAFSQEVSTRAKLSLVRALGSIGSPVALDFLGRLASTATDDAVQAEAIAAYTSIAGGGALRYLDSLKPVGARGAAERSAALARIARDPALEDRYDPIRRNDPELDGAPREVPALRWLRREWIEREGASQSPRLTAADRNELLDSLTSARGFGIWAVQGSLLGALETRDIPTLLRMRATAYYSPDRYSGRRVQTIDALVRYLRQRPPLRDASTGRGPHDDSSRGDAGPDPAR